MNQIHTPISTISGPERELLSSLSHVLYGHTRTGALLRSQARLEKYIPPIRPIGPTPLTTPRL